MPAPGPNTGHQTEKQEDSHSRSQLTPHSSELLSKLRIRQMHCDDIELVLKWAAEEAWNPGWDDGRSFLNADVHGFFIGELEGDEGPIPVSSISVVNYGDSFAFLGLYIVRPEYRGHGIGRATWDHAIIHAKTRNIGLDGVTAQQAAYERYGFKLAYRNIRFEINCAQLPRLHGDTQQASEVVDLSSLSLDQITSMDRRVFPADRTAFLKNWIVPSDGAALGLVVDGDLKAMGVARRCRVGHKIGPLTAKNSVFAEELLLQLCLRGDGGLAFLDVPELNQEAIRLAERWKMRPCFETARMYTGSVPNLALHEAFGVASFELG